MFARLLIILGLSLSTLPATAGSVELLMFETEGCYWCARWNKEVSTTYPKTQEGRTAPLHRLDIHDKLPQKFTLKSPPAFTPTFVVVKDGAEIGRIEGYPGEDFFWGLLEQVLKLLQEYKDAASS